MREVILGTAGHVDHGKTSLVRALTGIETDRLKEEKKRGITIELGFAFLDLPCGHRLGIIDVPGHEKFIKNMVAGAAGIDIVAFVIAADEGIMPQTREHFEICSLLGVKRGVIIITKMDMVDEEWLDLVQEEVRDFFADSFLAEAPMLTVSSTTGGGIDQVKDTLDKLVAASTFNEMHGPFRLPVDRVFSMKGFGAVITGTSISGRLAVGDEVMFYPAEVTGRVRGIQVHGTDVDEVEAGKRTAINVQGLEMESIARGDMLAIPDCLESGYMLDADFLYLSANKKNLQNRARVRVHIGSAEIMGRIVILNEEELLPGTQADVQILLESPLAIWPGDRYVIRSYSPVATIGGGEIFSASSAKRRRFKPINAEIFSVYRHGGAEDLAIFHVKETNIKGLTFAKLTVKMGVFGKKLKKILAVPISQRKVLVVESDSQRLVELSVYQGVQAKCLQLLEQFHQDNPLKEGMPKEELRSRLYNGLDPKLFGFMLNDLTKKDEVVVADGTIRRFAHKVSLQADTKKLRADMEAFYGKAGTKTPTIKELYQQFGQFSPDLINELLDVLVRDEVMVKISEELYFHHAGLDKLEGELIAFIKKEGEIDAQGFKGLTGLSRKFSIPLLEFFDKKKVTLRLGNKRILRGVSAA